MLFGQNPRTKRFKRTLIIIYLDKDWTTQRNNQLGFCERVPAQARVTSVIWTKSKDEKVQTNAYYYLFGQRLDDATKQPTRVLREGARTSMGNQCYLDKDWTTQRWNHFRASETVPAMRWGICIIWTRL